MKRIRKISCFVFAVFIISMFALQINAVEARVMPVQVRMLSGETYVYQPYGCAYVQTELVLTGDAQNGTDTYTGVHPIVEVFSYAGRF